jgi:hypothetical protein
MRTHSTGRRCRMRIRSSSERVERRSRLGRPLGLREASDVVEGGRRLGEKAEEEWKRVEAAWTVEEEVLRFLEGG